MPSYTSVMEKGYFGNEAGASAHGSEDVNAASSSFTLDFPGMLDATDSVLHEQFYEYLQGSNVHRHQQLDHQHQFLSSSSLDQGLQGTFPGSSTTQRLYPPSSTTFPSALSTSPGEPLRGFVDSSTYLSRLPSSEYRRKDKGIGTSTGMGMEALPAQMNFSDAFQAPVQPHLVSSSNMREFSAHETSCSPNVHLQRPGSYNVLPDSLNPHEPRHRSDSGRKMAQKIEPGQDLKSQRPAEQAEHIIRERQRRDDMTSKFRMLESLLHPGPKRDRFTVVEDSIQHVKSLHHRIKELHEKRSKLKSNAITSSTAKKATAPGLNSDKNHVMDPASSIREHTITAKKNPALAESPSGSHHALSCGRLEKIEVHMDLPHQIVIEMTCRPHHHIQSQIMAALERLGLEVSRCSISKHYNRLICNLVVKPQDMTDLQITGNDVIGALNHAVVPD